MTPSPESVDRLESILESLGIDDRPDPLSLSLLTEEELIALKDAWQALPPLEDRILLSGDVAALLADPSWNPDGRELGAGERGALERLAKNYQYFQRVAPIERHNVFVEPILPRLREAGAYLELQKGQFPPPLGRERHSHAERGPEGERRLYYFFPEDYPDLFHHKRVCEQQARVTFVKAYEIINGMQ